MLSHDLDDPSSRVTTPATSQVTQARVIVLAAGKGTRMRSKLPKVLHPLRGIPLIEHSLRTALAATAAATSARPVVVIGPDADDVCATIGGRADCAVQAEALGTGHAVMQARPLFEANPAGQVLVVPSDMPLIRASTLAELARRQAETGVAVVMMSVIADDPRGFGRVVRDAAGRVTAIVEQVACTPEQLAIRELNSSVYCFDGAWLWQAVSRIRPNPRKGEYFLTDLVEIAVSDGRGVEAVVVADADECIGVNTRVDLADADAALRRRINRAHMLNGVSIVDPATTYIDLDVQIGMDSTILPNTHLLGASRIGTDSVIGPNTILRDTVVGAGCEIRQSTLTGAQVDDGADIGPYSHLRPGAHICAGAHVGNFGEVKKSTLGPRSKMGHFTYLGDATVGEDVNIGAGTITCNYDGVKKNPTTIEDGAFIGSDTMLVAPVTVGARATTGAGAVVTKNVPADTVAVGLPARVIRRKNKA
jgi:bifunctional UDP-N-acetylglucosamine pyrophosphorylase / glucosamine-1-phosphate N-acetyltransferase